MRLNNSGDLESFTFSAFKTVIPLSEIAEITTGPAFGSIRHVDRAGDYCFRE